MCRECGKDEVMPTENHVDCPAMHKRAAGYPYGVSRVDLAANCAHSWPDANTTHCAMCGAPRSAPEDDRESLIAYGRSCGLDEASKLCSRMAHEAYYPPGSRFKVFTPKAQAALSDLLIKAANNIASLTDGPYDRFKSRQQQRAGKSEKS
jgi:hypothetical protein